MPTARMYAARNKLTNILLLDTSNKKSESEESTYNTKNVSNLSNAANTTKDDFSIFIDHSATTTTTTTNKSVANDNQIQQKKQNNDEAVQIFFDPTTVKDLHSRLASKDDKQQQQQQHSRKPLGVLADEASFATPDMPNFDLTDTTLLTTTTTTKFGNFDPCLASTRFFKANPATTTTITTTESKTSCFKSENDLEKEMQEMDEEEAEEAEKEKLLSEYLKKNGGENCKKSSWSSASNNNNNNNNTATESPRMACEKEAESGERSSTKKIKFADTTLSTKAYKTMDWDDYGHDNNASSTSTITTTQENESRTQSDLTKILSPSNKLFSDKTEKLNFIQTTSKQPKFDVSNFASESMMMTTTTTTGAHYNVNQDFKNNYYMLCPDIDITPSQTDSIMINKSSNRTINLEQPAELTSKLGGMHKIEESLLLGDIETTLVEDDDEGQNLIPNKANDESLTSEAMEQSFNFGFKKNFQSHLTDTTGNVNADSFLNKSEGAERMFSQLKNKSVNLEQPVELTSKLGASCLQRIDESELDVDDDESSMSNDACSEHNTTTNMNETIIQSIRNPFSYEIKNRLLRRCGGVDYLKTKSTYTSLMSNAPIIKEKRNVFLAGNTNYNVIKEIGKGSYAVIYAISNKNETCALKVNFLLFCLF